MAFDQSTRNRLQKFVNDARNLLTEEFTRQLQATYGLDPKAGSVAAVDSLTHLDNRQRQTANVLRDTLAHYLATTHGKGEKDRTKQALSRIVREQAFTVLNRLAALRMAEARGFLLETIAKGYNAKGFQLYKQLAGSSLGETGEAYRNYLYSVFDEFSLDLSVLFDRHSAQGRLFPRESALLELLDLINHHEIEPLWAEDETIGWIYQYFNSQEERKQMRAESQAPRNSRELAVRNQFFTPRYVVEFLTDNTLGRIWYEMTQGKTSLIDSCRYLVRRPTEVFLKPGELAPEQEKAAGEAEALSQEKLLKQPVYIPHRTIKDPRCIRMLDPACGSMHFGLYAFDLYERIYEEAWQLEAELGAEEFVREENLKPLHQTYDSFECYKSEIPRLIIEHNIHGVDIDPRAVQIAGLSLWQRAQRAWQQQGIKPQQRPVVRKSNIVCAEPMPGEKALLQEFSSTLNPPVLGQLLEAIFDKMELAGEAGTLLKIEEEIQSSIHEARDQWQARSGSNSVSDMFQAELDKAIPQKELGFDLSGVDDESFWDGAEKLILDALSDYADKAESNSDQKRLFAEDAAKGFAFIDLCRKRFDVVLMNPPFGEASGNSYDYISVRYDEWNKNILCSFIERAVELINKSGSVGVIYDRTAVIKSTYEEFRRRHLVPDDRLRFMVDLGWEVLDANVEVTTTIISGVKGHGSFFDLRHVKSNQKSQILEKSILSLKESRNDFGATFEYANRFRHFPNAVIGYDFPEFLREAFTHFRSLEEQHLIAYQGHALKSEKHFRAWWECEPNSPELRARLFNGSGFSPYKTRQFAVVVAPATIERILEDPTTRRSNADKHLKRGVCFGKRGEFFSAHVLPEGFIFTVEGQSFPISDKKRALVLLGFLNTPLVRYSLNRFCGQHKYSGYVNLLPFVDLIKGDDVASRVEDTVNKYISAETLDELSTLFLNALPLSPTIRETADEVKRYVTDAIEASVETERFCEQVFEKSFQVTLKESEQLRDFSALQPKPEFPIEDISSRKDIDWFTAHSILSISIGAVFGRWDLRYATGERLLPELPDSFAPLPICPPGMLQNAEGLPAESKDVPADYSLSISWSGILVDDENHPEDIIARVRDTTELLWKDRAEAIEQEACGILGVKNLREYFYRSAAFFTDHLKRYSKSRRQAPIYWPLQTSSGSYTLWLYYHKLTEQTLYACVNDFVGPKLEQVEQDLVALRGKTARNSQEEKELEKFSDLASELRDYRDELLRVAKFWKPNLNDGVQITAAPLWKLFQHKAWQKKLKETWEKLENGDYDWAHLACSIWPERVLRKCHQDRSLAIAHTVEDTFWHEVKVPVMRGKKATGQTKLEWQPKELTDDELNALIQTKIKEKCA